MLSLYNQIPPPLEYADLLVKAISNRIHPMLTDSASGLILKLSESSKPSTIVLVRVDSYDCILLSQASLNIHNIGIYDCATMRERSVSQ